MDGKSFDDGRLGLPAGPDTDMYSYLEGQRAAKSKTGVPGVAFTILIVAPLLYLIYPVLGVAVMGIFLGALYLVSLASFPPIATVSIGVILGVAGFFPAYKLEAMVSQFKLYRIFRTLLRPISGFGLTVALRSGAAFDNAHSIDFARIAGDKLLEGLVAAILFHFIFRRMDRIYFPARTEARRQQERAAKGIRDQRPVLKRFVYSLFWIIPVVAVLNLIIRFVVDGYSEGPQDRAAFYQQFSMFVYLFDFIAWSVLSISGILPGTAKFRKYVVQQSIDS